MREYASFAQNTHSKGLLFEKLIQNFLRTDRTYADKYDEVWLWQEWPGRGGKVDTGIDLVARDRYTGELCAIQCKFYSPHYALQKSDIDSFFTASGKEGIASHIIVSTTDKWSKHAEDALNNQQITTTRIGVDDLANSEIDWSRYSLTDPDTIAVVEPKRLREHQIEALNDVVEGFDSHDRGKLIMACGTGKTFTSLRIAERLVRPAEYREKYAADLKKMLPRIPKVRAFWEFSEAGRKLADLHINYETVEAYPLEVSTGSTREGDLTEDELRVTKMRFAGKHPNVDKSTIVYNEQITLSGIPPEAHEYMLGSRSAIEWILERYQVKTDKASGIVNDPNDWGKEHGNPRYILDLLKSIVTVSVETVAIVQALPSLEILDEQ